MEIEYSKSTEEDIEKIAFITIVREGRTKSKERVMDAFFFVVLVPLCNVAIEYMLGYFLLRAGVFDTTISAFECAFGIVTPLYIVTYYMILKPYVMPKIFLSYEYDKVTRTLYEYHEAFEFQKTLKKGYDDLHIRATRKGIDIFVTGSKDLSLPPLENSKKGYLFTIPRKYIPDGFYKNDTLDFSCYDRAILEIRRKYNITDEELAILSK